MRRRFKQINTCYMLIAANINSDCPYDSNKSAHATCLLLQTSILTVHMTGYTYPCIWTVTVNSDCPYPYVSMNMHGYACWMSTTSSTELSKRTGLGQSLLTVTVHTQGYTYPSIWTVRSKNILRQQPSTAPVQNPICLCFLLMLFWPMNSSGLRTVTVNGDCP